MKKCKSCGAPNPDNRTACYSCGESLDSSPQVNPNATPYPNAQTAANTVFDPDARTVIMAPTPPQLMTPAPPPTQSSGVFKPRGGSINIISTIFISIMFLIMYHMIVVIPLQLELKQQNQMLHKLTDTVNHNADALNSLTDTVNNNADALDSLTDTVNHNADVANENAGLP